MGILPTTYTAGVLYVFVSDEQTTDPSEDERQMAKVGSEDT